MSDTRPLAERLQDDQSLHWRAGERPLVESYLAAHPELGDDSAGLLDLLNHEVLLREERGEAPGLAEYLGRFPHLAAPLHDLFEVHALLEAEAGAADTPTLVVPGGTAAQAATPAVPGYEVLKELGRALDDEPPALPGYAALGRIDAGGMGVVWRVRDLRFRRSLAVKVMKSWACTDPGLARRFVGEAQVCGQLAHPFIVPVHAMGRLPDGRPYYAMKLVEGRTLAALLKEGLAPAERRTGLVQVFGQVCQAVAFAHGQGVIHRDLKPENVMVGAHAPALRREPNRPPSSRGTRKPTGRAPAAYWGRSLTCRRSRPAAWSRRSIGSRTCLPWGRSCARSSPASRPTPARTPRPSTSGRPGPTWGRRWRGCAAAAPTPSWSGWRSGAWPRGRPTVRRTPARWPRPWRRTSPG